MGFRNAAGGWEKSNENNSGSPALKMLERLKAIGVAAEGTPGAIALPLQDSHARI